MCSSSLHVHYVLSTLCIPGLGSTNECLSVLYVQPRWTAVHQQWQGCTADGTQTSSKCHNFVLARFMSVLGLRVLVRSVQQDYTGHCSRCGG